MKTQLLLLSSFFILSTFAYGQNVYLSNSTIDHNEGKRESILTKIEPSVDKLEDAWKDYLKDNYDLKLKGSGWFGEKNTLLAEKVVVKNLSDKRINFYTKFEESKKYTEMYVFGSLGYDVYFSKEEHPFIYEELKKMTTSFLKDFLPEFYQQELRDAQERMNDVKEEIADNKKDINDIRKEIDSLEKEISSLEGNLENNKKLENKISSQLENKKMDLKRVSDQLKDWK